MNGCRRNTLLSIGVGLVLAGCTASWQAPMENRDRSAGRASAPTSPGVARSESRAPRHTAQSRRAGSTSTYHRVRRGETLYSIAWRYNRDFADLARWNGIRSPYTIYPGQMVRLKPRVNTAGALAPKAARPAPVPKPKAAAKAKPLPAPAKPQRAPARVAALAWRWPVQGRILSRFSGRDATRNGLKLSGDVGQPVRAAEGGKVVYSGSGLIGYGRLIIIKHNERYLSAYGHNSRLLVKEGQKVTRGQQIADMGSSNTGTAMLHFEIRKNGRPIDPLSVLPRKKQ